jgi:outer membrane protein assembly factor BamD (BamD/ComL family)
MAGLDEELALLQGAQRALRDSDASAALAALRRHEREHPEGELREAREALAVAALCAAGDVTSAHRRRDGFLRSFPGSAYAAKVRRGCAVDPTPHSTRDAP